ncbi:MAG: PadR family transcriptional regulator [Spirochaetales bacterium]|nr:MAG: PadR family transcriptional regulator [Spirochaetales bacterium]
MQDWVRQFRKGLLELCILNLLSAGESYGYEIARNLEQVEGLAVSESTLYPILTRLKLSGLVKVRTGPSQGGPERRYLSLTTTGRTYTESLNLYWDRLTKSVEHLRHPSEKEGTE